MTILISLILISSFYLPLLYQPLSMGFNIMVLSFLLSVTISLIGFSLYGFLLFVVFVGGLLVMFGYVVVLIPNMNFFNFPFFFILISFFIFWQDFSVSFSDSSSFLFSDYNFLLYSGLVMVLLYSLIVVVKICYFHSGCLRPFFSFFYV